MNVTHAEQVNEALIGFLAGQMVGQKAMASAGAAPIN